MTMVITTEKQYQTVNPMTQGYGNTHEIDRFQDLIIPPEYLIHSRQPDELPVEITIGFIGTWDTYKSLKAVPESFVTCGITF